MTSIYKRTQHILFQHSAPTHFEVSKNLNLFSLNIERQGTYTEIEKGHQGPALPLP
jgi:hypothetical protein